MIKHIKEIHKEDICIVKIGKFYNVYNNDAYILSYLLNYTVREIEPNVYNCGFPDVSLKKVVACLENSKINYMFLDRKNEYDVYESMDYKDLNKYKTVCQKAKSIFNVKNRVNKIYDYLSNNCKSKEDKELIFKIEGLINERRKV